MADYKSTLTQEYLKSILNYDPETGTFTWKISSGKVSKGKFAGYVNSDGYTAIQKNCKHILAHRLAWLFIYGEWPKGQVDHINRIKTDNRIKNLRIADPCQNMWNSTADRSGKSGVNGVTPSGNRWRVRIRFYRKRINIGTFDTLTEAIEARANAEIKYHGHWRPASNPNDS